MSGERGHRFYNPVTLKHLNWHRGVIHRTLALLIFTTVAVASHPVRAAPLQQAPSFSGIWSSTQCEPRPGNPFAKRELAISGGTYQLDLTSFADSRCTIPTLRTRTEGAFVARAPSPTIPSTWNVEFVVRQVRLTPYVLGTAEFLNTAPKGTCGSQMWFVGIEQELAVTSGCPLLGIHLRRPFVEYDIATVQGNELFLGQRPPNGGYLTSPELRPITFGPPLTRTGDVAVLLPTVGSDLSPVQRFVTPRKRVAEE